MILLFLACSTTGISLDGKAVSSGDSKTFVQLCRQGDQTALEIKASSQKGSCEEAGEVLAEALVIGPYRKCRDRDYQFGCITQFNQSGKGGGV